MSSNCEQRSPWDLQEVEDLDGTVVRHGTHGLEPVSYTHLTLPTILRV